MRPALLALVMLGQSPTDGDSVLIERLVNTGAVGILALCAIKLYLRGEQKQETLTAAYEKKLEAKDAMIERLSTKLSEVSVSATVAVTRSNDFMRELARAKGVPLAPES